MTDDKVYERTLSAAEVSQRKDDCFDLLTERDGVLSAIDERKREIKTLDLESKSLDARISVLRHEVRSGKTLVTRQQELPLDRVTLGDVMGDPVEDPRDYCSDIVYEPAEPEALSPFDLRQLVVAVLPAIALKVTEVESWHADVRADVQRWAQVEHKLAHPIAGMPLPQREQLPNVLDNLEHAAKRAAKKKRGAQQVGKA
jgi:hypothetical protein